MDLISSWERRGIHDGKEGLVIRQLNRRFGSVAQTVTERLDELPIEQLDELGEALLDFQSIADLENWLSQH